MKGTERIQFFKENGPGFNGIFKRSNDHRSDAILIFNILHRVSFRVSPQLCFRVSRMLAGFHLEVSSPLVIDMNWILPSELLIDRSDEIYIHEHIFFYSKPTVTYGLLEEIIAFIQGKCPTLPFSFRTTSKFRGQVAVSLP